MKGLKITLTHGRVWTAETSDGKRAQGASLDSVLAQLLPVQDADMQPFGFSAVKVIFNGIRDSGNDGQIGTGQASA